MTKYIFVTGGVVSGIGKGISCASIGRMLKDRGLKVFMQKFDPYINIDPGTMSPYQHGEVFVTVDGGETDLDLGHYERFIDEELTKNSSITSGKVYFSVIDKERQGVYGGTTIQVIPHITDEIKSKVYTVAKESNADVVITEIGGTVGDIESLPFLEAIRQIHAENKKEDVLFVHTTLVPTVPGSNELKTKPTQHSYKELMSLGIKPDIFILRSDEVITMDIKKKISLFCDVPVEAIVQSENVELIYEVPLSFRRQGLDDYILHKLDLDLPKPEKDTWKDMVTRFKSAQKLITIGLVGKYVQLHDAYLSVANALVDAAYDAGYKVNLRWIYSAELTEETVCDKLKGLDGVLVPGGFGSRGLEGMILTSKYCREHDVPYFGICLGMQMLVVDVARHKAGMKDAHSTEVLPDTAHPIITMMPDKANLTNIGGTLRLGNWECSLKEGTIAGKVYGKEKIVERHRHRYELNNMYREDLAKEGMIFSGINDEKDLVEIVEMKDCRFHMGCQFHPEFNSRPNRIHPLFKAFVLASTKENA